MASVVKWRNGEKHPSVVTGMRNLPKRPVPWWGTATLYLKDGSKIESRWNSRGPITVEQAKLAMHQVVSELVLEVNAEDGVDACYIMQCR